MAKYTKEAEALRLGLALLSRYARQTVLNFDFHPPEMVADARAFLDAMKGERETCPCGCGGRPFQAPPEPKAVCPGGDSCPDARRYGAVHPEPKADERTVEERLDLEDQLEIDAKYLASHGYEHEATGIRAAIAALTAHRAEVEELTSERDMAESLHLVASNHRAELQRRIDAASRSESGRRRERESRERGH